MSGLFNRKIRRNYRQTARDSDDENNQECQNACEESSLDRALSSSHNDSPEPAVALKKNRSVLSFEDDLDPDDGSTFQVKKSNLSRRVAKHSKDSRKTKAGNNDMIRVVGEIKKISEVVDPSPSPPDPENGLELLDLAEDDAVQEPVVSEPQPVVSMLKKGIIPDATAIHLARKQRERAKNMLESDSGLKPCVSTKNNGRRLIREDDDDDIDDDVDNYELAPASSDECRPAFIVSSERETIVKRPDIKTRLNRRESELRSIREDFLAAEHGSDRDSDQETEWERQQIHKAMITQNPAVLEAIQPLNRTEAVPSPSADSPTFAGLNAGSVTLSNLKERLQERYQKLNTSLTEHSDALKDAQTDLERGKKVIKEARQELPELAKKFAFYQDMKSYIDDLIACFNEKMPKIEYLEKRTTILMRERYDKLVERRRLDMKDMADAVTQPLSSSQVIKTPEESKLLESKRRRYAERESRRIRRQRARELHSPGVLQVHIDGTSTDDEEPQAVIAKRNADIDALMVDANALFDDVVDEFCHLPFILQRFADWRQASPESYSQAYVALCLPQLFSPIVRVQLIGWNPILSDGNPIEEMKWFQDLLDFSTNPMEDCIKQEPSENGSNVKDVDDDLKVLPSTVEKVILERLTALVTASWDPLSERESVRLSALVRSLCTTFPTIRIGSRPTEQLFSTIIKRIEVTIQEDIFIPLYSKQLLQQRQGSAFQFFDRQFNVALKMMKNVLLWHDLISTEALQHIVLTCLVNRYLLVGLASLLTASSSPDQKMESSSSPSTLVKPNVSKPSVIFRDAVDRLKQIIQHIPPDWLKLTRTDLKKDDESQVHIQDPLAQLKRFSAQLIEHYPNLTGIDRTTDKELVATLQNIRNLLN